MVGIVHELAEFERLADEIISPAIQKLGGIPQPAISEPHYRDVRYFRKSYRIGSAILIVGYDNGDYHTGIEFKRRATSTPVSFDGWIYQRGDIEKRLKVRIGDKYLPMALRTYAELLERFGARFIEEQSSAAET